jgi:hypothetical protein
VARPGGLLHLDVKKFGRIGCVRHRISGDRRSRMHGIGWSSCLSPLMMPRAWPVLKCCRMKAA